MTTLSRLWAACLIGITLARRLAGCDEATGVALDGTERQWSLISFIEDAATEWSVGSPRTIHISQHCVEPYGLARLNFDWN